MIEILLATYNGEKFLQAQLDSILKQTYQTWCILAHDDGSSDSTLDILRQFQRDYPEKIKILDDGLSFGSARDNFEHLLKHATADYIMLCDQDDVWMSDKIVQTFSMMKKMEYQHPNKPVLVHTDLIVANEKLGIIAPSLFDYQRLKKNSSLSNLMVRNNVTGCTVMLNKMALTCAMPIPNAAMMHDWWFVLKVKQQGVVAFVDRPTIYYRQHGKNCLGAEKVDFKYFLRQLFVGGGGSDKRPSSIDVFKQAQTFNKRITLSYLYFFKYSMLIQIILFLERFRPSRQLTLYSEAYPPKEKVVIFLSAFEGAAYLEKQIQSIQEQSFQHWELLIRDDGSSDMTYTLLKGFQAKDERIHLLPPAPNVGVINSFSLLAQEGLKRFPEARYFMFADQDDIWLPLKIETTLMCMQHLEEMDKHVLVHTDLEVVNESLQTIAPSFFKFQHIQHERASPMRVLLAQNFVTGCTVMVNKSLLEMTLPMPKQVMMHDWWLALSAACAGRIGFVSQTTMLYRQHHNNSVGAKGFVQSLKLLCFASGFVEQRKRKYEHRLAQAKALQHLALPKSCKAILAAFIDEGRGSVFKRLYVLYKFKIMPQGLLRKCLFILDEIIFAKKYNHD